MSIDKEKHDAVLSALGELMRTTLEGTDRNRFARVQRLSIIGQKLMLEAAVSADDLGFDADGINGDFDLPPPYAGAMRAQMRVRPNNLAAIGGDIGGDQAQMVREMMGVLGPQAESQREANQARKRTLRVDELNGLLEARERLLATAHHEEARKLGVRIERLMKIVSEEEEEEEEEKENGKPDQPEPREVRAASIVRVVPAVDVRGPQAGTNDGHDNAPHHHETLPDGENGSASALHAGDAPERRAEGMGD